jgi:hypothetical protein
VDIEITHRNFTGDDELSLNREYPDEVFLSSEPSIISAFTSLLFFLYKFILHKTKYIK